MISDIRMWVHNETGVFTLYLIPTRYYRDRFKVECSAALERIPGGSFQLLETD